MKKTLLFLSALTTAASFAAVPQKSFADSKFEAMPDEYKVTVPSKAPARAEGEAMTMDFGYSEDYYSTYRMGTEERGNYIYMAFQIPEVDQQTFIGAKIKSLNFITGVDAGGTKNCVATANAFVTETLNEIPTKYTSAKVGTVNPNTWTTIDFEEPYVVTGDKPLYVGYFFKYSKEGYYMPVDGIPTYDDTCLVAVAPDAETAPEYGSYAYEIGSLCMSITLEGDNLPTNQAVITDILVNKYYSPASKISYQVQLKNMGANDISSVKVHTDIENGTSVDKTVKISSPIKSGKKAYVTVTAVPNKEEGVYMLTSSVVAVNGVDVENPSSAGGIYASYAAGFDRRIVLEEGTGTWCGFCPRGLVMMEYLKENYPDWILIGAHYGDEMESSTYMNFIRTYISGYPQAVVNRAMDQTVAGDVDSYYASTDTYYKSYPAYAQINLAADCPSSNKVDVTASVEFSLNANKYHQLAFALVEDNVGPYTQNNYFSGGTYGPCGGWEDLGSSVEGVIFDDVARYLDGFPGIEGSLPDEIEAHKEYSYTRSIPLKTLSGTNFRVVGMVINTLTGEILNANQIEVERPSGVDGVKNDSFNLLVQNGSIVSESPVKVYTLDGRQVSSSNLAKGVYIVTADGKSKKIFVK